MTKSPLWMNALSVVNHLRAQGFKAYFAGGCVRDYLLQKPFKDIDIATSATPDQVQQLFDKTIPVGEAFGVVVVLMNGFHFEVTTFRKDLSYKDGRHPEGVAFVDDKEDALRRDFTINGLFYDPNEEHVLDYVGGQEDLKKGIIRAIGKADQRFEEDKLRVLRAIRFSARFNFPIEQETYDAVCRYAPQVTTVSAERIGEELIKMFVGPHRGQALKMLAQSGLLQHVLPEVQEVDHAADLLDYLPDTISPALALAAVLHNLEPAIVPIARRLRWSNELRKTVIQYVQHWSCFARAKTLPEAQLKKILQAENIREELLLYKAHCQSQQDSLEQWEYCLEKLASYSEADLRPTPLLSGEDLKAMGYCPSPLFAQILDDLELKQLGQEIGTIEQAKAYVRKTYPQDI